VEWRPVKGKWLILTGALVAVLLVVVVGASSCGSGPTSVASDDEIEQACEKDFYGCVEYGPVNPVRLGALLWLSAGADPVGVDSRRGVELAIDYLDGEFDGAPGSVLGHEVRIDAVDDGCDQEQGIRGAETLANTPGLLSAVGTTCSSSALNAAAEVFNEKGILLISPTNTAPELTDPVLREEFYARTAPNDLIQGNVIGTYGARVARGGKALAITDNTAYTESLVEAFSDSFPKERVRVTSVRVDDGSAQIRSKVLNQIAKSGNPAIIYFPLIGEACGATVRALGGVVDAELLTSDGCLNADVLREASAAGTEVFASGPDVRDLENSPFYGSEFLPAYREQYGERPTSVFHAHAFDAANLIFDAFRRTALVQEDGSIAVPRTAFKEAVFSVNGYDGFSGRLSCVETGDCQERSLISIYRSPAWPIEGGTENPKAVFSQAKSLSSLTEIED
jgi:branched-chain amino acid transport system substrate-binding protein